MTVTVPTLALVLPFLAAWLIGSVIEFGHEWNNQIDRMLLDDEVTPQRFIRGWVRALLVGWLWPVAGTIAAIRRLA